jgi:hypothetical protein
VEPLGGDRTAWGGSRTPAFATGVIKPPEGVIRPLVVVIGVPALRHVPMGESNGSISDKTHNY